MSNSLGEVMAVKRVFKQSTSTSNANYHSLVFKDGRWLRLIKAENSPTGDKADLPFDYDTILHAKGDIYVIDFINGRLTYDANKGYLAYAEVFSFYFNQMELSSKRPISDIIERINDAKEAVTGLMADNNFNSTELGGLQLALEKIWVYLNGRHIEKDNKEFIYKTLESQKQFLSTVIQLTALKQVDMVKQLLDQVQNLLEPNFVVVGQFVFVETTSNSNNLTNYNLSLIKDIGLELGHWLKIRTLFDLLNKGPNDLPFNMIAIKHEGTNPFYEIYTTACTATKAAWYSARPDFKETFGELNENSEGIKDSSTYW